MKIFLGIPAADGIGLGKAFVIPEKTIKTVPQKTVREEEKDAGWKRFLSSVRAVTERLNAELEHLPKNTANKTQRDLLEAYTLMLGDPIFAAELKDSYEKSNVNIEHVVDVKSAEYAEKLRNAGDDYLAERARDITDVFALVLDDMLCVREFDANEVPEGAVIVASSLSPTDTIALAKRKIAALALTEGGLSSHVVILARNYGIPAVVGINNITHQIQTGETVAVNGKTAEVIAGPDDATLSEYRKKIEEEKAHEEKLKIFLTKSAETKDGTKFQLYANIGTPEEADFAVKEGADGIGLFRTEFLYMSTVHEAGNYAYRPFDEDVQFNAYKHALGAQEKAERTKGGAPLPYAELYDSRPYLNLVEWSVADVNGDVSQYGLSGSPTKVKTIENIVFQAKESRSLTDSDADIEELMKELISNHTIG